MPASHSMSKASEGFDYQKLYFDLVSNGEYDAACELLDLINQRLASSTERDVDRGFELCLPLPLAISAKNELARRRELLGRDPLSVLLRHAATTVPFYRRIPAIRFDGIPSLDDVPLVSRFDIIGNYDQFLSESFASEEFKRFKATTGTVSAPMFVWFDQASYYDLNYATYGYMTSVVPSLVAAVTSGQLAAVLVTDFASAWRASTVIPSLNFARLDRRIFIGDPECDARLVQDLRSARPLFLCGLASSLSLFADVDCVVPAANDRISPLAIFVSGESFFEDVRERLEQWFQCQVFNAYVSTEGGLIALECPHRKGLHVCHDRVHLEILNSDGTISDEGCGEMVLTNFINWAQPFIRYRTGDRATLRKENCECGFAGSTLVELLGREAAHFTTSERVINPRILDDPLTSIPIRDFTVIQEDDGSFEVNWRACDAEIATDVVESAITSVIRKNLGDVKLSVNRLEPRSSPARKAHRYINRQDSNSKIFGGYR